MKRKPTTRPGLMINGGRNQGKTETAAEAAAAFEDLWLGLDEFVDAPELPGARDLRATVAYVQTPVTATPKSTCQAILDFFGTSDPNLTLTQLVRQVRASLRDHRTRVLILDDITRLRMHRKDDQDTLDLIRALMSMRVTLVLIGVGIPDSGLLSGGWQDPETGQWQFPEPGREDFKDEASTQTARRFDLVDLRPFSYDTADDIADFVDHLAGLEDELRLFNAREGMLTGGDMPEYIYRRTGGVVGLIERLIEDGASLAMDTGIEEITEELLDRVVIRTQHPKRDRAAGEEGEVPPALPSKKVVQGRRPRNTVFDDKGVPLTAGRR
ncbi:AAA family ATPase [Streptomyces olivaceoviridis]